MTESGFATVSYEDHDRQVSWHGLSMANGDDFNEFLTNDVASRLHDEEGTTEFEAHLRSLANTGFARDSLNDILAADIPEERDWAVGEAMAEAYLGREHEITWPWNMEKDKRNPKASLPGADLVGFKINGDDVHLALGEVKTSTDGQTPPGVMSGRSGMTHQIDNLANKLSLIRQLLFWLLPRCKGTEHEASFNKAIGLFFESGNKAVALFGVLIRDTQPNELDLRRRGQTLSRSLQDPTTCQLIAIYLPCNITDLPVLVTGGES
ncbi:hypothetical protein MNBD_GAMMA13-765 [hydrothermal vent metagenome]|uniref:Anti-bacteriophage protein A/HamA C-terminal domain-containing protein n=1 Tax=hydrothermal vent metagenome TaxID=652676 RepID=A0A3B0ZEH0_9ZZZZ